MTLRVSICIPAYNEEKNITNILDGLLKQKTDMISISKIIVVSSGSTDGTDRLVKGYSRRNPVIHLLSESKRNGKAAAINAFLKVVDDEVVVIESADTVPEPDAIENLCAPFITHKNIGMTGGAPIPVNDPNTFLGFIIHTWWWFHRHIPRFGEIIAYRNILKSISTKTAVDEAYIQAKLVKRGFQILHVDEAVVRNKGPETIADLTKQRRRIFNGHSRLYQEEQVKIDNMTQSSLKLLLFKYNIPSIKLFFWFMGGICLEFYARLLGMYDTHFRNINPYIWDTATTTKHLDLDSINKKIIVFFNFAPFQFAGGAERWMVNTASHLSKHESVTLMDVHPAISNIYAKTVLRQTFDSRSELKALKTIQQYISLTPSAFLPWTSRWREVRQTLAKARSIYMRYELLETLIILYFGGLGVLKKTIAGIHSPFIYAKPLTLFDGLHNRFYASGLSQWFLSMMHKVHVLKPADQFLFTKRFQLQNVVHVPNYTFTEGATKVSVKRATAKRFLHIAYVGEMNLRKGFDILVDLIKKSSNEFIFHIAGDGPLKDEVKKLIPSPNVHYLGYAKKDKLAHLYRDCDVLFVPSRAESFSLVFLEAMSYGLPIISSPETHTGLPPFVQMVNQGGTRRGYFRLFKSMLVKKHNGELENQKIKVHRYVKNNLSRDVVIPQLMHRVFEIKPS